MKRYILHLIFTLMVCTPLLAAEPLGTPDPDDMILYDDEENTELEVELGKMLFFDTRLSVNGQQSCATCHNPDLGFSDGMAKGVGTKNNPLGRNTPHIYNMAWSSVLMWDGREPTLEQQALGPIASGQEMMLPLDELERRLNAVAGYRRLFKQAYDVDKITRDEIARAIAAFERTIVIDDTPFDRYLAGDTQAMSQDAIKGLALFKGKGNCTQCHDGPNFTDDSFHSLGIKDNDPGRAAITGDKQFLGAFKTPGLRNTELTAPYMHDGSLTSLMDVVKFYNQGGGGAKHTSNLVKPLNLTAKEERQLVAFLKSLTQPFEVDVPKIP
ncbi:cytochrome-c peroxidase [Saccharobesus litoralis]|nr:cytochrome c peroxidase [Saccharobesus litoralis]